MNRLSRITLSVLLACAAGAANAQSSITPTTVLHPDNSADLTLTVSGPSMGVAVLLVAPAHGGPFPTPWGLLHVMPPTILGYLPLSAAGFAAVTFHVPADGIGASAVFQAATVDPGLTAIVLSDYVSVAARGVTADSGKGAAGSYSNKNGEWSICVYANPGTQVEIVARGPGRAEVLARGVTGHDGFFCVRGDLDDSRNGKLKANERIDVDIGGATWMPIR
jgi:hypothetical protein